MHTINIIFGSEATKKTLAKQPLSHEEINLFQTKTEAQSFVKVINEAVGWQEVYVLEDYSTKGNH